MLLKYGQLPLPNSGSCSRALENINTLSLHGCGHSIVIRDVLYWTAGKNSFELIELSSINIVSLVQVSSCSNTGSIRDDAYWTSRTNRLELIELFSINKVGLV